jgi:hypothetical protein
LERNNPPVLSLFRIDHNCAGYPYDPATGKVPEPFHRWNASKARAAFGREAHFRSIRLQAIVLIPFVGKVLRRFGQGQFAVRETESPQRAVFALALQQIVDA